MATAMSASSAGPLPLRQAVIAANLERRKREPAELADDAAAVAGARHQRGVDEARAIYGQGEGGFHHDRHLPAP